MENEVFKLLEGLDYKICPTGSRVICSADNTDYDFVVYEKSSSSWYVMDKSPVEKRLLDNKFIKEGSEHYGQSLLGFKSWRRDEINLIVTHDKEFFDRFVGATKVACRLRLKEKIERIDLFQAILYENYDWQGETP